MKSLKEYLELNWKQFDNAKATRTFVNVLITEWADAIKKELTEDEDIYKVMNKSWKPKSISSHISREEIIKMKATIKFINEKIKCQREE